MERWGRIVPCMLSLWPGLPQLWRFGSISGLIQALSFAFLLQLTVFTTLIWPETIGPLSRGVVWFCVFGFWLLFAAPGCGHAMAVCWGQSTSVDHEHLFRTAQREYLRGSWPAAERSLRQLLGLDAGDVEARLMLTSLYRRIGRVAEARQELDRLVETYGSEKWSFEIRQERLLIRQSIREAPLRGSGEPIADSGMSLDSAIEAA